MVRKSIAAPALAMALAGAAGAAVSDAEWRREMVTDPFDDAQRPVAWVMGTNGKLSISCDRPGAGTWVAYETVDWFGTGRATGVRKVTYRFDQDASRQDGDWRYLDAMVMLVSDAGAFLDRLAAAERFSIRGVSFRHREIDDSFNVRGGAATIAEVRSICR